MVAFDVFFYVCSFTLGVFEHPNIFIKSVFDYGAGPAEIWHSYFPLFLV